MDELKRLIENKDYLAVLEKTAGQEEPSALFYRISAFLALNKGKEAMDCLLKNRKKLFDAKPELTLKTNFEVRFALAQYEEAFEDYEIFSSYPYVSQSVEEILRVLPKKIREKERQDFRGKKELDEEEVGEMLSSSDPYVAMSALQYLKAHPELDSPSLLVPFLKSKSSPLLRTFGLLLLVEKGYSGSVEIEKNGEKKMVVPSFLTPPFQTKCLYGELRRVFEAEQKNPTLSQIEISLLDDLELGLYPTRLEEMGEKEDYLQALTYLATLYLGDVDESKKTPFAEKIAEILANNPPLN